MTKRQLKNIIILADGTWNQSGRDKDTNVVKLYQAIERNTERQIAFYDEGVGSDRLKVLGGAFGIGISQNIQDCYRYLVENYEPGDMLFFYGFSRGAYTVRSLGGLIGRCGLLRPEHADLIMTAYNLYRREEGPATVQTFKERYARPCRIRLVGVWDTVGALGIPIYFLNRFNPFPHRFHDTELSSMVEYGRQALAIDDDRRVFQPTLWDEEQARTEPGKLPRIKQVWFAGAHTNVGGGYPNRGLSDITLRWMIEESKPLGLRLKQGYAQDMPVNPNGRLYKARKGVSRLLYWRGLRKIPAGQAMKIHQSVIDRMEAEQTRREKTIVDRIVWWKDSDLYRPPNLQPEGQEIKKPALELGRRYQIVDYSAGEKAYPSYELAIGEARTVKIEAKKMWNYTQIFLFEKQTYRFTARGHWHDMEYHCDANGYQSEKWFHQASAWLRRAPGEDWFALIGSIKANEGELFRIGAGRTLTMTQDGMLTCFANDLWAMYWNNSGAIELTVMRVDPRPPSSEHLIKPRLHYLQKVLGVVYRSPTIGKIIDAALLILFLSLLCALASWLATFMPPLFRWLM